MKTQNLDEAVFLNIKGHQHIRIRAIADRHSEWTFEDCKSVERLSKEFWSGAPVVSLNKWIMIRYALKNEQKTLLAEKKPKKKTSRKTVGKYPNEMEYYYKNNHGVACLGKYGKAPVHEHRIANGNFFKTLEECKQAITDKKV